MEYGCGLLTTFTIVLHWWLERQYTLIGLEQTLHQVLVYVLNQFLNLDELHRLDGHFHACSIDRVQPQTCDRLTPRPTWKRAQSQQVEMLLAISENAKQHTLLFLISPVSPGPVELRLQLPPSRLADLHPKNTIGSGTRIE